MAKCKRVPRVVRKAAKPGPKSVSVKSHKRSTPSKCKP
jgi:hypothetical protein